MVGHDLYQEAAIMAGHDYWAFVKQALVMRSMSSGRPGSLILSIHVRKAGGHCCVRGDRLRAAKLPA